MEGFLPILIMIALGVGFAAGNVFLSQFLGPRKPSPEKSAPYECGIIPSKETPDRFPVRFYLVALIFIVFDVEVIFLYPYVLMYRSLGAFGLIEMIVFSIAVISCLIFLLANGALDWGPRDLVRRPTQAVGSQAALGDVRLVGLEGRDPNHEVAA